LEVLNCLEREEIDSSEPRARSAAQPPDQSPPEDILQSPQESALLVTARQELQQPLDDVVQSGPLQTGVIEAGEELNTQSPLAHQAVDVLSISQMSSIRDITTQGLQNRINEQRRLQDHIKARRARLKHAEQEVVEKQQRLKHAEQEVVEQRQQLKALEEREQVCSEEFRDVLQSALDTSKAPVVSGSSTPMQNLKRKAAVAVLDSIQDDFTVVEYDTTHSLTETGRTPRLIDLTTPKSDQNASASADHIRNDYTVVEYDTNSSVSETERTPLLKDSTFQSGTDAGASIDPYEYTEGDAAEDACDGLGVVRAESGSTITDLPRVRRQRRNDPGNSRDARVSDVRDFARPEISSTRLNDELSR